jgi:hypothetical protein
MLDIHLAQRKQNLCETLVLLMSGQPTTAALCPLPLTISFLLVPSTTRRCVVRTPAFGA